MWHDPRTGMYVITRYDDLRAPSCSTPSTSQQQPHRSRYRRPATPSGSSGSRPLYEEKGWLPAPTLAGRDDPEHRQMRALFDHAFRPAKIKQLDPFVEAPRPSTHRRLHRRGPLRLGAAVRRPAAADRHRQADGRAGGGHLADQGVDRRVGAAARDDADRRGSDLVDRDGDRGAALLPADLRAPAPRARRHPALRRRQHADRRVGALPHRQRAARRDDGRHVRRRFRDQHQRPLGRA